MKFLLKSKPYQMKKLIVLGFVLFIAVPFGYSQNFNKARLDTFFQTLEANNKFMGSVAISQNGKLLYTKTIGYAEVESKIKATENTKYRIGSISKTFTAVLVIKAVEEKKLKLSETLDGYFKEIMNAKKISIEHLLSHRSGIHNFTATEDYLKWNTQKKTEKELLDIIVKGGSDFEPGTKFEYSNSNYVLLTFILQKVYKKEYAQILEDKIIKPLGLKNTYFGKKTDLEDNECYSYRFKDSWIREPETDMSIPLGAGALVSTPTDLVRFADAVFSGKLVSPSQAENMKTLKDNYGKGLFRVPFYDRFGYGHNGGIDGFTSVMYNFADGQVSIAVTSNGSNFDNNQISIALLSTVFNRPYELPNFKTFEVATESLDQYLGVYSSTAIPLKITITKKDKTLVAQATGQPAFPLESTDLDQFKFDQAGVILEFIPDKNKMILKQGGGIFEFTKEQEKN